MSTYDKASLVLIPSGTKEGVVFSQKPTNGDGDFTFTRSSAATRVNEQGLIEKERGNLLLQSNQFDTTWTKNNTTLTSGQSGYDGSSDAWKVEANASALTRVMQSQSISANTPITISVYAKSGNVDFIKFNLVTSGTNSISTFDLTDGSVYNSNAIDENWQSIGNGWVRISATYVNSDAITQVRFEVRNTEATQAQAGDFLYIQDAQLNQGLVADSYLETTTTAVYGGITDNIPRLDYTDASCPSLLLEPQRTNLIAHSEYFGGHTLINVSSTANATTSPEGVENASKIIESSSFGEQSGYLQASCTTLTDYTISIFAKANTRDYFFLRFGAASGVFTNSYAWFDLSNGTKGTIESGITADIEDYGNGWYRLTATRTSAATAFGRFFWGLADANGSTSYTGDGSSSVYAYGFQVEESSYPTSYIPTYGASVTFASETCNNAGNSSLFNDSEGVLYAEIAALVDDLTQRHISVSDGTIVNVVRIHYHTTSNSIRGQVRAGGAIEASLTHIVSDIKDFYKVAISYKENDVKLYINGVEVATDTNATMPTGLDELSFHRGDGNLEFYGKTNQILYFPTALTNEELADLTTI